MFLQKKSNLSTKDTKHSKKRNPNTLNVPYITNTAKGKSSVQHHIKVETFEKAPYLMF